MASNPSIEQIQEKLFSILIYFQQFCNEHKLHFVLAGGTCLGAVRHHGFIPWDDDLDVFMLREDYERLVELWDRYADKDRYSLVRSNDTVNIQHSGTEIKDNNTTFIQHHSVDLDINHGLMIDVIPLDQVATKPIDRVRQMVNAMVFCCYNFQRMPNHKGKVTYYATKLALGIVRSPRMRYRIWKKAEQNMIALGDPHGEMVASFIEGVAIMRQHFPRKWVEDPVYLTFVGQDMPVLADYDSWLTMSYGDYMQLPPENERVFRHNSVFADMDNSYIKYKGIYYCKE